MAKSTALLGIALALALGGPAFAQVSDGVVKIGIINDETSAYSYVTGQKSVIAARMAVEDFGGTVLGKPIEILVADQQNNNADLATTIAKRWADVDHVDAFADGTGSSVSLAIQEVARTKNKSFMIASAATSDLTGKFCNETSTQWSYDTYALSNVLTREMVRLGAKNWYLLTADYAFGYSLQNDATKFLTASGGKVVGSARVPLSASDYSANLLQATNYPFDVLALASSGVDTVNMIKQMSEFHALKPGQRVVSMLFYVNDVFSLGLQAAQGLQVVTSFYWDLTDETRAWTKRYMEKSGGQLPNMLQAGLYSAVTHYLQAVQAAGTDEAKAVNRKMREMRVNDFYNKDVEVRANGRVLNTMYLMQVKSPAESKSPNDVYKLVGQMSGEEANRPLSESACPLDAKRAQN